MKFTEAIKLLEDEKMITRAESNWQGVMLALDEDRGIIIEGDDATGESDLPHLSIEDITADDWVEVNQGVGILHPGDPVLYKRSDSEHYELGEVKRRCDDGSSDYFVYYHQGDTAARTPYDCLRRISNLYAFDVKRIRASDVERGEIDEDD